MFQSVRDLRKQLNMSQPQFADWFYGFPLKKLRDLEQGRTKTADWLLLAMEGKAVSEHLITPTANIRTTNNRTTNITTPKNDTTKTRIASPVNTPVSFPGANIKRSIPLPKDPKKTPKPKGATEENRLDELLKSL